MLMVTVVLVEQVGDPAGVNSTEEGKKSKFVHLIKY